VSRPLSDWHAIWGVEWYPERNHLCQISCWSVKGFLGGRTPKSAISYTYWNDFYNSPALLCRLWKVARVEVNLLLAFLHWVGIAFHPWPFVSDVAIFVLKGYVRLQIPNCCIITAVRQIQVACKLLAGWWWWWPCCGGGYYWVRLLVVKDNEMGIIVLVITDCGWLSGWTAVSVCRRYRWERRC